ncbi:PilZ domain-containing protein [Neptuniibacter halophilus]|uniref:PilZ domain-containing protein n=1 Tax=Neptuniibacter halophilus TaxID=651666 RepID=UPI002573EEFE|nr:PilZ domain-containing protein [Neptuniibacter halophilus]
MKIPLELKLTENENRRQAFRVEVDGEVNVRMTLNDHPVKLLDISATGVAFETDQQLSGDLQGVEIYFEVSKKYRLKPRLHVSFCANGRCGAEFNGLSERAHMALAELVVALQKARIRYERRLNASNKADHIVVENNQE